jgi:predicted nucleic acid-binding Zn ribbon protein
MRRSAPRPLAAALGDFKRDAAPQTLLASVQACWPEVAGPVVAAEAQPVSERSGTLTFGCSSGTWANELELLAPDLLERLNHAVEGVPGAPARALRFRVGGPT